MRKAYHPASPSHHRSPTRVVVILLFAVAGAFIMGSIAQPTLNAIYRFFYSTAERAEKKPTPATDALATRNEAPASKKSDEPKQGAQPATEPPTEGTKPDPAKPDQGEKSPPSAGEEPTTAKEGDPKAESQEPGDATSKSEPTTAAARQDADVNAFEYHPTPLTSVIPFALLGAILGSWIGVRFITALERIGLRWDRMDAGDKVTLFVGIFAGLIASVPLLLLFQALPSLDAFARVVLIAAVTLGLSALSVYALQTMSDILPWNRDRGPMRRSGIKVLDTNVIIDGRIYDVAKTGFLDGQMYVPGFVLEELQYIADSHDPLRRQRGRRGLETLRHMQNEFSMEVRVHDRVAPDLGDGVDARLVRLAKAIGADIVTNDFNLRRVAELQGVHVLSLNDLALALRPNVLPQESLELTIIREGNQPGQGVGYLEDGTMVVVEHGRNHIGETMEIIVTQVIQTERGKMIFGEIPGDQDEAARYESRTRRQRPRSGSS